MTVALVAIVSLALGATYTHVCWWRAWHRWTDEHNYRQFRVEDSRVKDMYDSAQHEFRLRRRAEWQLLQRDNVITELSAAVERRDRQITTLTTARRRSAMPDYGQHRTA